MSFAELWAELEPLGRDPGTGGYRRYSWTPADAACRAWFIGQAGQRGLAVEPDNNGNLWAWWGEKGPGAIVTGSHLDSVPDGGGVGIGRSIHAGQVCVADGSELAAAKLERVLTNDPAMGVIRHTDAGYDLAATVAAERGVRVPMAP